MPDPIRLSVVIPALNEAPTLPALCEALDAALGAVGPAEWIVIDDGSADDSARVLRELAARHGELRVVRLRRTFGKAAALSAGFARARGRWIATLDADLQDDPAEIPRLLETLEREGEDVAVGWRRRREDPRSRILASRIFNLAVSAATGRRWRDINCGLKVLRREVAEEIDLREGFHRFLPYLAELRGFRAREIEIRHRPRRHGASRYGGERVPAALFDLLVLLFLYRADHRPGQAFARAGAAMLAAGAVVVGYLACLRLATGTIGFRYPLLTLGVLLVVLGVQLIASGILGDLLARSAHREGRAIYSVREEYGGPRDAEPGREPE